MKTRLLLLLTLVAAGTVAFSLKPAAKNQCRLSLTPVFVGEDERVLQLTIETREPTRYRLLSKGSWGGAELPGNTAETKPGRRGCKATVWLVISHVTPSSGDLAYIKIILQGDGGRVTQTREIPKGSELSSIIRETMPGDPQVHPLNTPALIGGMDGQDIWLMVGGAVSERKAAKRSSMTGAS